MRKTLISLAAGLSMLALPAFADGVVDISQARKDITADAAGKTFSIATVVKVDGIAWFDRMRDGVKQFGDDTGHDVWQVGPSQADAAAQVQLIENLIAQGVLPDDRVTGDENVHAPIEGTGPPPPDPSVGIAHYDPATGQYAAPGGDAGRQTDLVDPPSTWQDLLVPAGQ